MDRMASPGTQIDKRRAIERALRDLGWGHLVRPAPPRRIDVDRSGPALAKARSR